MLPSKHCQNFAKRRAIPGTQSRCRGTHAAEKCVSFHEIANCTDAKHKKHQKIIYQSVLKIAQR